MSSSTTATFDANDLGTDIVTIHVGPNRKAFAIHKNLICNRSAFFSKAFNGPFMEGVDGTMQLPEDDSQAFSALVVWMYRDQLPLFPTEQYKDDGNGCDMYVESLLPLFHLAEKLCINALANQIMDRVQDVHFLHSRMFGGSELETVYAYSHGGSKIRTYGVLMVIQRSSAGEVFDEGHANEGEESDEELLGGFLSCKNPSQTSVETSLRYR